MSEQEIEKKKAIEDFAIYVDGLLKEFLEKNPKIMGIGEMGKIDFDKMPLKTKAILKPLLKAMKIDMKKLPEISVEQTSRTIRHLVYEWITNNPNQIKELLDKALVKLTELHAKLSGGSEK